MSSEIYSPPEVDRIWGIWGSYYNIPKAIFYLLKGHYRLLDCRGLECWCFQSSGFIVFQDLKLGRSLHSKQKFCGKTAHSMWFVCKNLKQKGLANTQVAAADRDWNLAKLSWVPLLPASVLPPC